MEPKKRPDLNLKKMYYMTQVIDYDPILMEKWSIQLSNSPLRKFIIQFPGTCLILFHIECQQSFIIQS